MTLDVTSERGRAIFHQLIASADVFLTNLRDRGLRAIGADLDTLLEVNPALVYAQGGGLGPLGPLAHDPCQDTVGMAFSGFMDLTSPTGDPNYPPGSLSDVLTGTNLASAVMAGLLQARATGRGGLVRSTQVQSLLWLQMLPVGMLASLGLRMPRFVRDQATPMYSAYRTQDGWMAIAAIHAHQWPPLAQALGLEHLLDDERFEFARLEENKTALVPHLEAAFSQRTTAEWHESLRAAGVWCSPVNRLEDLPGNEQVLANDYLVPFPDGFAATPLPFEVNGWPGVRGTAAGYNAQTEEILEELGYDHDQRTDLRAQSVIW
jgi:crotonobetainyl-CoA:carnitine CoA-transferase CaiB-like acyl-CoA transferase